MAAPGEPFGGLIDSAFEDEETPRRRGSVKVFYGNKSSGEAPHDPRVAFLMEHVAALDARLEALEARVGAVEAPDTEGSEDLDDA